MRRRRRRVKMSYWIVWSVDDRPTFKSPAFPRRQCRYMGGVVTPVNPKKRIPFSYVAWTMEQRCATSSPWSYDRADAERLESRAAAFAMRRLLWLRGWGRGSRKTLRDAFGITRVTRYAAPTGGVDR